MRREDLSAPTLEAARSLVGALLVREPDEGARHGRRVGRIVEVEAYIGEEDLASHARFGRTPRNTPMYGPPGFAYVYRIYGMYDCLNVVTEPEGRPAAVLIRAVEPTEGVEAMRQARIARMRRRGPAQAARLETLPEVQLAAGPGLVAAAFDIDLTDSGVDLFHDRSRIHLERGWQPGEIVTTPRVGIGYAAEPWRSHSWRFIDPSSPAVSGPRTRS